MGVFVSPAGRPEEWRACPEGYVTPEAWRVAHPPEPEPGEPEVGEAERLRAKLFMLDRRLIRPLGAVLQAMSQGKEPPGEDLSALLTLEAEREAVRERLRSLENG